MNKKEETKDYGKLMTDDQNRLISINNPEAPYIEFGGCDNYIQDENGRIYGNEELETEKGRS